MSEISPDDLLSQIEAYSSQLCQTAPSLRESEEYLFAPIIEGGGEILCNSDFRIEELTDDDLDIPLDFV